MEGGREMEMKTGSRREGDRERKKKEMSTSLDFPCLEGLLEMVSSLDLPCLEGLLEMSSSLDLPCLEGLLEMSPI